MRASQFSVLVMCTFAFTIFQSCQKEALDFIPDQYTIDQVSSEEDVSSFTGAIHQQFGDALVQTVATTPFAFEVKRFNRSKQLMWNASYRLDRQTLIKDAKAQALADRGAKIIGTFVNQVSKEQEIMVSKLDALGEMKWNTLIKTEKHAVELVDHLEDPAQGSFIQLKEFNDDGTESYVIVYICAEGEAKYGNTLIQSDQELKGSLIQDAGELIRVVMDFEHTQVKFLIDKQSGKVKDSNLSQAGLQWTEGRDAFVKLRQRTTLFRRMSQINNTSP